MNLYFFQIRLPDTYSNAPLYIQAPTQEDAAKIATTLERCTSAMASYTHAVGNAQRFVDEAAKAKEGGEDECGA